MAAQQSFVQQASTATASETRQLYNITRSEATWLTNTFIAALEKSADGSIEAFRVFRDALETQKPAYLGRFNNSQIAVVQCTFYTIAAHLFDVMERLFKQAANINHDAKVLALCKRLPTSEAIAYVSISYLNWAVYNWHYRHERTITEDLSDNCYETQTCAICDTHGKEIFYYSTAYGLEQPVCGNCLSSQGLEKYEDQEEYVPSASETEESEAEESASETDEESDEDSAQDDYDDDDEDDPDYVCEEESECDEEYTEDSESDELESNATEETDLSEEDNASETGSDNPQGNTNRATASLSLPTTPVSDAEEKDKFFGCDGCPYEFKQGWKTGYKAAMKEMRNYAIEQKHNVPTAPECAVCGDSHENLQKCGGCHSVRYCSERCQRDDWREHKRVCRRENLIL